MISFEEVNPRFGDPALSRDQLYYAQGPRHVGKHEVEPVEGGLARIQWAKAIHLPRLARGGRSPTGLLNGPQHTLGGPRETLETIKARL